MIKQQFKGGHNLPPFLLRHLREAVDSLKYIVIKGFMDVDGFRKEGSIVDIDDIRAAKLRLYGLIGALGKETASIKPKEAAVAPENNYMRKDAQTTRDAEDEEREKDVDDAEDENIPGGNNSNPEPEHIGGGIYLLPDGSKVKGKARAIEALKESR